jgi:hypothetical protein
MNYFKLWSKVYSQQFLLQDIMGGDDGEGDMQGDWPGDQRGPAITNLGNRQPEIYTLSTRFCIHNVHHYMGYFTHS